MVKLVAKKAALTKEDRSRLGRRSRNKGASFERKIAEKFKKFFGIELSRTPQSGGFMKKSEVADNFRGDILPTDKNVKLHVHVECKNAVKWSLPSWLAQAESDCPKDRKSIVIFHKDNSSIDYVCLKLEDFLQMVKPEQIYTRTEESK